MRRAASDREADDRARSGSVLRAAMVRFVLLSVVVTALLTLLTLAIAERIARDRALEDARRQASGIATRLVAPLVDADVRTGTPGAADALARVLSNRTSDGSVAHVKLWSRDGTVIWADQPEIVGRSFALTEDVTSLFGTTRTSAELSELSREENVVERGEGPMLEVYAGAFDADGEPLVFEAYLDTAPMDEVASQIVRSFVPLIVGSLLVFQAAVLPLAVSLSRQVERGERDRARLTRHAVLASDLERRRIARELHDGVVQELAGLGYTLPSVTRALRDDGDLDEARSTLEQATGLVQRNVQALRKFMTDIYPPGLEGPGLRDAVHELVQSEALAAGLTAEVRMAPDLELQHDAAGLAYRVVREAVRNVVKHAGASSVVVDLALRQDQVFIRVSDDGRGATRDAPLAAPEGHLGLRLLEDTVRDAGGRLEATSAGPGLGVSLVARFPATLRAG